MIAYKCSSLCIYYCVCWITGSLVQTFTFPESITRVLPEQLPQQAVGDFGFFLVKLKNQRSLRRQYSPVVLQLWAHARNYAAQIDEGQACEYFREILIYTSGRTLSSEDEKPRKNITIKPEQMAKLDTIPQREKIMRIRRGHGSGCRRTAITLRLSNWKIFVLTLDRFSSYRHIKDGNCKTVSFSPEPWEGDELRSSSRPFFGFMLTLVRRASASETRPQRWPNKTQWIIGSETPL